MHPEKRMKTFKATGCEIQCYSGSIWKHWQLEPHLEIFGYISQGQCSYPKSSVVSVTKVQIMLGSPFFVGKCRRILVVCCEFHLPTPGSQPEVYWKNGTFRLESKDNKDSNSMCKDKVRIGEGQEAGCHMCFTAKNCHKLPELLGLGRWT